MTDLDIPKKTDLTAIPKDEIIKGIIIDLESTTWAQITKDENKKKTLKNPDGKVLIVRYEVNKLKRNDIFPFSDNPTTTSRYGRFIAKYGDFEVGQVIKVQFDDEGDSNIVLAK